MFNFYKSKLNADSNYLWQRPRQGQIFYSDEDWYEKRRVGHHTLESLMKNLIKDAKLNFDRYTNHSIRATVIGTLDDKGFEARHITAISSHKNENTIKTYSKKCPESKKREMYDTLNETLIAKKPKQDVPEQKPLLQNDQNATINITDMQSMGIQMEENMNINNNNSNENLPPNFQLVPFDTDDDNLLLKYLQEHPIAEEKQPVPVNRSSTSTNIMTTSMPVIPKMYFQNSNVTINYNFSK